MPADQLAEFYYEDSAPHEALGRAARRLTSGGALYLGAGVGVERVRGGQQAGETFTVLTGSGTETHKGPLSAVTRAFTLAGGKRDAGTPGGKTAVKDPAVAARLRELDDAESSAKRDLREYEARARRTKNNPMWGAGNASLQDDSWEARRTAELRDRLTRINAERSRLLGGGSLEEELNMWLAEEAAKGQGGHATVGGDARKKLAPLVKHYMGKAHPFRTCVRDQVKHGLSQDHAERRCAVIKDIGHGGDTSWREGRKRVREAEATVAKIEAALGEGAVVELAQRAGTYDDAAMNALAEEAAVAHGVLYLFGKVEEGFNPHQPRAADGKWVSMNGYELAVGDYADVGGVKGRVESLGQSATGEKQVTVRRGDGTKAGGPVQNAAKLAVQVDGGMRKIGGPLPPPEAAAKKLARRAARR